MGKLNTMSKDGLIKGIKEVAMHHIEAYEKIDRLEEKERANVQRDYTEFIGHVARLGMFRCNDYYIHRDPSYVYTYVCVYRTQIDRRGRWFTDRRHFQQFR